MMSRNSMGKMKFKNYLTQPISTSRSVSTIFHRTYNHRYKIPSLLNVGIPSRPLSNRGYCKYQATEKSAVGFDDYEAERKSFKLEVPQFYNFSVDVIDKWAAVEKETCRTLPALWVIDDDSGTETKWSFQQLSEYSNRVSNILEGACGLRPGDRVVVMLPRIPPWWLINIAAIRTGMVLIPCTTQLSAADVKHRLQASGARCIITDSAAVDKVESVIKDCPDVSSKLQVTKGSGNTSPSWLSFNDLVNTCNVDHTAVKTRSDDPMTIFFTSGTTGAPKMAEHTHASYGLAHSITGRFWLDLTPNDVHWCLSDTGWAKAAWSNFFAPWIQGACVFIHNSAKFDPQQTLQMLCDYPVNVFCGPPTAYRMIVQENMSNYNMKTLRHTVSAGEPLNPEVIDSWYDGTGRLVREGYGQTETVLQLASFRCIPMKPGSLGKPPPGMNISVVDNDGKEVAPGVEGDIAVCVKPERPLGMFSQYLDDPERTARSFIGDFYLTGDRALKDEDGYFWFVARSDDVIISAGYRIGPFEVESVLIEHPAVLESAVVSSPDPVRGEVVKAFIVLTDQYKEMDTDELTKEIQAHVKTNAAPFKYPRKVEFVEILPKTVSGKIRRIELREREWVGKR